LLALSFSLHAPPSPPPSPLLLLPLLLGSLSEIQEFSVSSSSFSPIGGCLIINFFLSRPFEIDSVPTAVRKRAAVQRPKTVGTYLMLGLVDSIFVHTVKKPVCPCRVNRGRDWLAIVLFHRGRAVSNGRRGCMGKMIPPHFFDWWVLAQHT